MAEQNRNNLKTYFETGDRPTQTQFEDLIDSVINIPDDGISINGNTVVISKDLEVTGDIYNTLDSGGTLTLFESGGEGDPHNGNRITLGADDDGAYIQSGFDTGDKDIITFRNVAGHQNVKIDAEAGSLAVGDGALTSDERSLAVGYGTQATGVDTVALGYNTLAQGVHSLAAGEGTQATGVGATALGTGTQANAYTSIALGQYNTGGGTPDSWVNTDPLFEIGNGTSSVATSNAVTILKNGNVGIGTSTPTYLLQLNTDSAAKPGTNLWTVASDKKLKKNIKPFTDGLESVKQINPVWYHYNGKGGMPKDKQYAGVIAQEMQEIAPYTIDSFVHKDVKGKETEYLNYNGNATIYMLINAIKELEERLAKLENSNRKK